MLWRLRKPATPESATPMPEIGSLAPLPDKSRLFEEQDAVVLLAMCVWGESRGEARAGKDAVACVVRNRVGCAGRYGMGFPGVVLKPYQFSCFNRNDPNRSKLLDPLKWASEAVWTECYEAAAECYGGLTTDPTKGAVFYFSQPITEPPKAWGAVEHTVTIGNLHFCREIRGNALA